MKTAPPSFKKFQKVKPRTVSAVGDEMVRTRHLEGTGSFPLVIEPAVDDLDLAAWAADQRGWIEDKLLGHGALLFRGFGVSSVRQFEDFATAVCEELFGEYADLPNEEEGKKVYRSTPYPPDKIILFHNESSHMHQWPRKQLFHCVKASEERGETPIVDCRVVYEKLDPQLRERFERLGLLYERTFLESLDVSWQDFFHTEDRQAVEDYCRRTGMEWEWLDGGGLKTRQKCPAVITHHKTGEKVFFNQIQLHHVSFLDPEVRDSLVSLYGANNMPRNVRYGDGTPIEDEVARRVEQLYWDESVQFPWQEGDVLAVDNMLIAHARNPFVGERRIAVAMGEIVPREAVA